MLELARTIMVLKRASEGKTPEPQDIISNLVNVKNMLERTGFPTYTLLSFCVNLKVGAYVFNKRYGEQLPNGKMSEPAKVLEVWADNLMAGLIAYKRKQREEAIQMVKRGSMGDETTFHFSPQPMPVKASRFSRLRSRGKQPEGEFENP